MSSTFIQDALAKIKETVVDLSCLEVVTYRGNITTYLKPVGDGASDAEKKNAENNPIDWAQMIKDARGTQTEGKAHVAMATLVEFDGDVQIFVSDPEPPQWVLDAHKAAVQSSLEARKAILDLFSDAVKKALN